MQDQIMNDIFRYKALYERYPKIIIGRITAKEMFGNLYKDYPLEGLVVAIGCKAEIGLFDFGYYLTD